MELKTPVFLVERHDAVALPSAFADRHVYVAHLEAGLFPEAFEQDCLIVCLTVKGSVQVDLMGQRDLSVHSGTAWLIPRGELLSWRVGFSASRIAIALTLDEYQSLRNSIGNPQISTDPVLDHFASIFTSQQRDVPHSAFLQPFASTIVAHFLHRQARPVESNEDQQVLKQLKEFVDQRLAYDLGVDDLAKHCELSKFQLLRLMKKQFNQTPQQFVIFRRIERAKNLLRRSETSLADIAFLTGFSSQSHLSNTFKQIVGVTPKAFRDGRQVDN